MRHSKTMKKDSPTKEAAPRPDLDSETRALIREIMDPYWAWRFARS